MSYNSDVECHNFIKIEAKMSYTNYKNKKILIIFSGFMSNYLEFFLELCEQHQIIADIVFFDPHIKINHKINQSFYLETKINTKNPLNLLLFDKQIQKIAKNKNYDYIFSDTFALSNTISVIHSATINKKCQIINNPIIRFIHFLTHIHRIIFNKIFYKNCPKLFAVSTLTKEDCAKNYNINPNRIKIVYPGFQFQNNKKIPHTKNNEQFVIGINANGFRTKGGFIMIDALKYLIKKHKNIKVRIIYPKHQKNLLLNFLIKLYKLEKYIEFLGIQKDMTTFYSSIDCLVCPSLFEAFGRVVTEAMNFNLPVIISSNTGAKDIIKDEINGLIFELNKKSGKNLAEKIEYLIENPEKAEKLAEKGAMCAQNITWKKFAMEIFNELYPKLTH